MHALHEMIMTCMCSENFCLNSLSLRLIIAKATVSNSDPLALASCSCKQQCLPLNMHG